MLETWGVEETPAPEKKQLLWEDGLSIGCRKMDSGSLSVINFYDPEMPLTLWGCCFLSYEMKGWDSICVLRGQSAPPT